MADSDKEQPIIIKKIKKGGHGHHGGVWKVAYADFVTAMMAFFIVMWILAASDEQTKKNVEAYFNNPGAFSFVTGKIAVPIDMGQKNIPGKKMGDNIGDGTGKSRVKDATKNEIEEYFAGKKLDDIQEAARADSIQASKRVQEAGDDIVELLAQMKMASPELTEALESTDISYDPNGLRIELVETDDNTFFEAGSSRIKADVKDIISIIGFEIGKLPNSVTIEGHTDSKGSNRGDGFTNWELSSDRANAARRVLEKSGIWDGQVQKIVGFADSNPYIKDNPFDKSNRRVTILINYLTADQLLQGRIQQIEGEFQ